MKPLPFKMIVETETEKMRHDTFWSKEPESLAWIESFDGGVFYDIGANVGVYSLYCAALHPEMEIYAFEPVHANFIRLIQNVELNGFENVHCFNVALGHPKVNVININIPNKETGTSGAQVGITLNEHGKKFMPAKRQKVLYLSLDEFLADNNDPTPDYIKVDIDGREFEVIKGMENTFLYDEEIKSMLIEHNEYPGGIRREDFIRWVRGRGHFTTDNDFNKHPNHSNLRRGGNPENIIFTKEG